MERQRRPTERPRESTQESSFLPTCSFNLSSRSWQDVPGSCEESYINARHSEGRPWTKRPRWGLRRPYALGEDLAAGSLPLLSQWDHQDKIKLITESLFKNCLTDNPFKQGKKSNYGRTKKVPRGN